MPLELPTIYNKLTKKTAAILILMLLTLLFLNSCASTKIREISIHGVDKQIVVKNTGVFQKCHPVSPNELQQDHFEDVRCNFKQVSPDILTIRHRTKWQDKH